jgi:predicted ATPase
MITHLHIKNFKSLKEVDLNLRNLNLLTGLNGSGKSSLIQVLLLLRQSKYDLRQGKLVLRLDSNYQLFDAGVAEDIYYRKGIEPKISFHFSFNDNSNLNLDFGYQREIQNYYDNLDSDQKYEVAQLENIALFNDSFQYLFAERELPRDSYPASVDNVIRLKTLGIKGEHTAFFLETFGLVKSIDNPLLLHPNSKSEKLLYQVNAWLSEISPDVNIDTKLISNSQAVQLRFKYGIDAYKPKNVGFGLSYVLPVIVALLTAEKGKLIIIENPESHIHPRGQAELGKLIAAAADTGAQLLIETHSDHILNGIRVAVKENNELRNKIAIFFHDRVSENEEQFSKITPIRIDKQGELSEYPSNFLDEWSNQLFKLV